MKTEPKSGKSVKLTEFKSKSAWDTITPAQEKVLEKRSAQYIDFLSLCKTERETIEHIEAKAKKAGFKPLPSYGQGNKLKPGSRVYFINKNRAMGLAIIGKKSSDEGFRLIASHHDVPKIDIKPTPVYEKHGLSLFKTHYYGGIKKFQWPVLPLALHGFAITKNGKILRFKIGEDPKDPVFTITDIAPHICKKIQEDRKTMSVIKGEELNVIVGHRPIKDTTGKDNGETDRIKKMVLTHLHKDLGLTEEDLAWAELHAVPAMQPREVGFDRALIGGYGHDDRACVAASYAALEDIKIPEHTAAIMFLDKEEIGSCGANGAQSMMVTDFLGMLTEATSGKSNYADVRKAISETFVISADTSPPIDPTFESAHDPLNSAIIGNGVWVTKYAGANGKFMSSEADVEFLAYIRKMLCSEKIPYQFGEMGKVDEGGGGTVAFLLGNLNMHVIDIALATLSLHSPFEVISKVDYHYTVEAYKAFMQNSY